MTGAARVKRMDTECHWHRKPADQVYGEWLQELYNRKEASCMHVRDTSDDTVRDTDRACTLDTSWSEVEQFIEELGGTEIGVLSKSTVHGLRHYCSNASFKTFHFIALQNAPQYDKPKQCMHLTHITAWCSFCKG